LEQVSHSTLIEPYHVVRLACTAYLRQHPATPYGKKVTRRLGFNNWVYGKSGYFIKDTTPPSASVKQSEAHHAATLVNRVDRA
jgi:hypothetical protein